MWHQRERCIGGGTRSLWEKNYPYPEKSQEESEREKESERCYQSIVSKLEFMLQVVESIAAANGTVKQENHFPSNPRQAEPRSAEQETKLPWVAQDHQVDRYTNDSRVCLEENKQVVVSSGVQEHKKSSQKHLLHLEHIEPVEQILTSIETSENELMSITKLWTTPGLWEREPKVKFRFPGFDGSYICGWNQDAEAFFEYYETADSEQAKIAIQHLEGVAKSWYDSKFGDMIFKSWDSFLDELWNEFEHFGSNQAETVLVSGQNDPGLMEINNEKDETNGSWVGEIDLNLVPTSLKVIEPSMPTLMSNGMNSANLGTRCVRDCDYQADLDFFLGDYGSLELKDVKGSRTYLEKNKRVAAVDEPFTDIESVRSNEDQRIIGTVGNWLLPQIWNFKTKISMKQRLFEEIAWGRILEIKCSNSSIFVWEPGGLFIMEKNKDEGVFMLGHTFGKFTAAAKSNYKKRAHYKLVQENGGLRGLNEHLVSTDKRYEELAFLDKDIMHLQKLEIHPEKSSSDVKEKKSLYNGERLEDFRGRSSYSSECQPDLKSFFVSHGVWELSLCFWKLQRRQISFRNNKIAGQHTNWSQMPIYIAESILDVGVGGSMAKILRRVGLFGKLKLFSLALDIRNKEDVLLQLKGCFERIVSDTSSKLICLDSRMLLWDPGGDAPEIKPDTEGILQAAKGWTVWEQIVAVRVTLVGDAEKPTKRTFRSIANYGRPAMFSFMHQIGNKMRVMIYIWDPGGVLSIQGLRSSGKMHGYSDFFDMDPSNQTHQHRMLSVKLWPPSQSTRLMLVERMTKNLTTPSIFSRKYGLITEEEAKEDAKQIEELAFAAASQHFQKEPDGDGSSAVQIYAKESSKLMLEVIKRGPKVIEDEEEVKITEKAAARDTLLDISGGRRAFIEAEEIEQLLKPLSEPGNSYSRIRFNNRSFGLGAANVAAPILSSMKDQLTEVDLSDFVAGRPEAEALEVMSIFSLALEGCQLRYLNLSDNALGEKGVRAFDALIKSQTTLEELYLMNDGISEHAARAVRELLPSTEKLKILHFHNNMTGDEGAVAISDIIKTSPSLIDFRCSSTRVGFEGGVALAEALGYCTNMKKLDLRDNMFGVEGGLALSKTISSLSDLTEIYFSYINLEDEGTKALMDALKVSAPSLEILELAGNEITAKSAALITECIASKQLLTTLNLSENELKDEGSVLIAKAIEGHERLMKVDLSTNQIRRAGARALAQAAAEKPGFKSLDINGNFISDEGIDEVVEMFKNSPGLLGPLDENDPEGEDYDDEDDDGDWEGAEAGDDDLDSKLKELNIKQEEE